jgi:hypothetical protein
MTYMRSWKSLRLTSHTWLGLNPQIGRPLSRIVVPLVYFYFTFIHPSTWALYFRHFQTFNHQMDSYRGLYKN